MEMLCICHQAKPYGHLLVNGQSPNDTQLAVLTGIPQEQVSSLLAELETSGVFSRTSKRVIYSRRMIRDEKKSRKMQERGEKGGNPKLCNDSENSVEVNLQDNQEDKPQKPEAREIIYAGKVIRLTEKDFTAKQKMAGMSEDAFVKFLHSKDDWLATLPEHEQKQWWFRLDGAIKQIRKHNS